MKVVTFKILLVFSTVLFVFSGCSKDEPTKPKEDPVIAGEYFPIDTTTIWCYSSNALSEGGVNPVAFETKFGTYTYENGRFDALLGRLTGTTDWHPIISIKDSAGIVFSLGDNPPESPFPLFKHQYTESEVTWEDITINGKKYETLKRVMVMEHDTLTLWFADQIGLVKEFSRQGMSLFSDANIGRKVTITTELTDRGRIIPIHTYPKPE
ncbi:MAG: hypothetical protein HF314_14355 [Ignavibacteria bacterium]|nr:hypothetical protein [Ignavibacteria bacterium]MCU7504262.1 hypothetical protein [Ignavibacteria bacterium]MCU7516107.1 hypothetical protein [Ignavibacteria bacterium]